MGDYLVVGVNRDEDLTALKGPPVLNVKERAEILRHCKFIDEVIEGTEYTPTLETLTKNRCSFYAHGDDPCIDINGVDVTAIFTKNNMYKQFKRTEGVSTTSITGKLLDLADFNLKKI